MDSFFIIVAAVFAVLFTVFFIYVALQLKSPEINYGERDETRFDDLNKN